jgi:D-3-phosphoglycerate dehydrogenase
MKVAILDDYQHVVRTLDCFEALAAHEVVVVHAPINGLDTLPAGLADAQALVLLRERTRVDEALLARLPALRLISQSGPVPHIDLDACTRRGVAVSSGAGAHAGGARPLAAASRATAELTWALILASARHLVFEVNALRQGQWQSTIGRNLHGRTLGILGYGQIGAVVASYGKAFGMRVLVHGREGSLARAREDGQDIAASREALFAESDVLSLHLRLAAETRGGVTARDLASMKSDALFVNTSRAELVAPGALEAALRAGRPGSAALDVFAQEPVAAGAEPLVALDNALCTPHLGYVERAAFEQFFARAFDQVNAFAAGAPVDVRNPDALRPRTQGSVSP